MILQSEFSALNVGYIAADYIDDGGGCWCHQHPYSLAAFTEALLLKQLRLRVAEIESYPLSYQH